MDRKNMYAIIKNEINLPNGIIEQLENLYQCKQSSKVHTFSPQTAHFSASRG